MAQAVTNGELPIVLGSGFGGFVALQMAIRHPDYHWPGFATGAGRPASALLPIGKSYIGGVSHVLPDIGAVFC
jgi:pimeloyl-ACP methyl ester carboxylesterase